MTHLFNDTLIIGYLFFYLGGILLATYLLYFGVYLILAVSNKEDEPLDKDL